MGILDTFGPGPTIWICFGPGPNKLKLVPVWAPAQHVLFMYDYLSSRVSYALANFISLLFVPGHPSQKHLNWGLAEPLVCPHRFLSTRSVGPHLTLLHQTRISHCLRCVQLGPASSPCPCRVKSKYFAPGLEKYRLVR